MKKMQVMCCRRSVLGWAGAALLLAACGEASRQEGAVAVSAATACALDGMLLSEYPGPQGQIHYDQGRPDFFCNTVELLSLYLRPEQKKRVTGVYTQDMARADWDHPVGHWIDARQATYVAGSKRAGAMGPTLATFAQKADAEAFQQQYGGRVLAFAQITPEMVSMHGGATHDERM
jgi:copper chaperone NosL